jgi:hypothetical protein
MVAGFFEVFSDNRALQGQSANPNADAVGS